MIPVILSGGSGTRLWPLSRRQYPKQFLKILNSELSLFQETLLRMQDYVGIGDPLVVCNEAHRFVAAEQLRQLECNTAGIILESEGKNTAPALALASLFVQNEGKGDEAMIALSSDHFIGDLGAFHQSISVAEPLVVDGYLATFGVAPSSPETGYGYIEKGGLIFEDQEGVSKVGSFKEKPDLQTAESYLGAGKYLWNSGIFVFTADDYLNELNKYHPEIVEQCDLALSGSRRDMDFVRVDESHFSICPDESIDIAVMENTDKAVVVSMDCQWNDVGAWNSVADVKAVDADENSNVLNGDVYVSDSRGNLVYGDSKLVALLGVDDLVVVDTKDALLVAKKSTSQDVKVLVDRLKAEKRTEASENRLVYRPWGSYDSVDQGSGYQVKKIVVEPGRTLSLQKHHHRAEHWIVVKGTARVVCGEKTMLLTENQSTYIPLGEIHQLANPGKLPLELIEVQSGEYLGEDDIVRLDDEYGRSSNE